MILPVAMMAALIRRDELALPGHGNLANANQKGSHKAIKGVKDEHG